MKKCCFTSFHALNKGVTLSVPVTIVALHFPLLPCQLIYARHLLSAIPLPIILTIVAVAVIVALKMVLP